MLDQVVLIAAVTVLGLLEQAYFSLMVIYARRKYSVSPPATAGPPEFERIYRAQVNCSEYFPIFVFSLWLAGVFFSQGMAVFIGLLYLYGRFLYFHGYAESSEGRLEPLYFCAKVQWALIALAGLGIICTMTEVYLGLDMFHTLSHVVGFNEHS
nr:leukotriene C4 synthase [Misgurnus anguillicaudatus]